MLSCLLSRPRLCSLVVQEEEGYHNVVNLSEHPIATVDQFLHLVHKGNAYMQTVQARLPSRQANRSHRMLILKAQNAQTGQWGQLSFLELAGLDLHYKSSNTCSPVCVLLALQIHLHACLGARVRACVVCVYVCVCVSVCVGCAHVPAGGAVINTSVGQGTALSALRKFQSFLKLEHIRLRCPKQACQLPARCFDDKSCNRTCTVHAVQCSACWAMRTFSSKYNSGKECVP